MKNIKLTYVIFILLVVASVGCIDQDEEVFGTFSTETIIINDTWKKNDICFVHCADGNTYSTTQSVENEIEVGKEYEVRVFHHRWGDNLIIEVVHREEMTLLERVFYRAGDR